MLKDCIQVFEDLYKREGEKLILDRYVPAEGTYIIVRPVGDGFEVAAAVDVRKDKKTKEVEATRHEYYNLICQYDYHSRLIDINKPIDSKKIIHSNNYLAFFVKKESIFSEKLTDQIIEGYYKILSMPTLKYFKNSRKIYKQVENEIGAIDIQRLEKIKLWICDNIYNLDITKEKNYLKIFFEYPLEEYLREEKRYLLPNIYNKNENNITVDGKIYGMPNNNIGLNLNKPALENKTRPIATPYLLDNQEVLMQKYFFDFLTNMATLGENNVYVDIDNKNIYGLKNGDLLGCDFTGLFLRIQKGKEVEIHNYDTITGYKVKLEKPFLYDNILGINLDNEFATAYTYKEIDNKNELQVLINELLFAKFLTTNYFTDPNEITITNSTVKKCIVLARTALYDWLYKDNGQEVYTALKKVIFALIKYSTDEGYSIRAAHQLNFYFSIIDYFEGGAIMADMLESIKKSLRYKINLSENSSIDSDDEYYFAIGQIVSYLLSKSKSSTVPLGLLKPILNSAKNEIVKEKVRVMYNKYNHEKDVNTKRFKNMYTMVLGYIPDNQINQDMIHAGYLSNNLMYESLKEVEKY